MDTRNDCPDFFRGHGLSGLKRILFASQTIKIYFDYLVHDICEANIKSVKSAASVLSVFLSFASIKKACLNEVSNQLSQITPLKNLFGNKSAIFTQLLKRTTFQLQVKRKVVHRFP